jgi:small subunit ribosomal protein S11
MFGRLFPQWRTFASTSIMANTLSRQVSTAKTTPSSAKINLATSLSEMLRPSINKKVVFGHKFNEIPQFEKPFTHVVLIKATKNNTHVTCRLVEGKCLTTASAGVVGLKKANRGSSDAGYQVALRVMELVKQKFNAPQPTVHVMLNGFGPGRDQAFRAIRASGWVIHRITDCTPIRFAGCRPRKKRRL